ncbi:hypothetical protein CEQ90_09225 [Lewinellaceae bacterium SD302]|nr:hypothetical protein CEQ90_09225 [Lewinellaceae bacterium SD302]
MGRQYIAGRQDTDFGLGKIHICNPSTGCILWEVLNAPMSDKLNQIIRYYRDCYQFEYNTESIYNFFSSKVTNRFFPDSFKFVSQENYHHPVVTDWGEELAKELALKSSEKKLVAGVFFVKGQTMVLGKAKKVFAPLFLQNVHFDCVDDVYLIITDSESIVLNPVVVGFFNDLQADSSFTYDELSFLLLAERSPFAFGGLIKILDCLKTNFPAIDASLLERRIDEEELRLADLPAVHASRKQMFEKMIFPDVAIGLVDKPVKSKGVINELSTLANTSFGKSSILSSVFLRNGQEQRTRNKKVKFGRSVVPVSLSEQQKKVVKTYAEHPISVVIGPPGTGKSFSIAALAVEAMHNGQKVLIASKNEQACQVIYDKITQEVGLKGIAVNASKPRFRLSVATRLRNIGNWIGVKPIKPEAYKKLKNEVAMLEGAATRLIEEVVSREKVEVKWGKKLLRETTNLLIGIQKKWIAYRHDLNRPIWTLKNELHDVNHQLTKKKRNLIRVAYQNALYRLLSNHRRELLKLEQAFLTNHGNEVKRVFESVDFNLVLQALPIWLCRSADVADILPLDGDLFDLLIIDEASQCDIASSIPLLYRAKSAVVVGNPHQLRHLSFLSKQKEASLAVKYALESEGLAFRNKSVLDQLSQAVGNNNAIVFLDEHYRSMPDIIDFSNKEFYSGQLKIMTSHPGTDGFNNLEFIQVNGQRNEKGGNEIEAIEIIGAVKKIVLTEATLDKKSATSIGLISPFRAQVSLLKKMLKTHLSLKQIKKHRLLIDTPFGFQGEERDKVYLSFTLEDQSHSAAFRYLNRPDVFNVGITRAKYTQYVYHSFSPARLKDESLLAKYLSNIYGEDSVLESDQYYDDFMHAVEDRLLKTSNGMVYLDRLVSGARLDIVVVQQSRTVGFDLVGFPGNYEEQLTIENIKRLERAGIDVFILPFSSWYLDRNLCKKAIDQFLVHC